MPRLAATIAALFLLLGASALRAQAVSEVFAGLSWGESGDSVVAKLGRVGFAPLGPVAPGNVVFVAATARDSQFVVATIDSTRRLRQVSTLNRAGASRVLDVYQEIVTALSMKHGASEQLTDQAAGGTAPGTGTASPQSGPRVAMRKWTLRRTTILVLISPRFDVVVAYDPITPPSNRARLF